MSTARVMPGSRKAASPKSTAATPRNASAHQLWISAVVTANVSPPVRTGCPFLPSEGTAGLNDSSSEGVLHRRIQEIAVLVRPRLPDELAGREVAVACIAQQVTREVVCGQQIHLGADVTGGGHDPRPEHASRLVVDRVAIGGSPEEVLLQGQGQIVDGGHRESRAGADDVLPPDVVDVSQVRVAIRVELVEGADASARPLVPTRIVELQVDAG